MPRETVVIFDPDYHTQWTLKSLLEIEQYIVITLSDIERLKKNFKEFQISALITEYVVNGTYMLDQIKELKKDFPELYVMILTDQEIRDSEYKKILNSGVDDLFLKPFSMESILLHLKNGLNKRRLLIEKKQMASNRIQFFKN